MVGCDTITGSGSSVCVVTYETTASFNAAVFLRGVMGVIVSHHGRPFKLK